MRLPSFKLAMKRVTGAFDAKDIPVAVLAVGLAVLTYGANWIRPGLGFLILGALLVLYVRPLKGWWEK